MTGVVDRVLSTLFDALMKALWSAIAVLAILWLGMISSLFWNAAHLLFTSRGTKRRFLHADAAFLKSMHIRP